MTYSSLVTETHSSAQYSARSQPVNMVVLHHAATTDADWVIGVESSGSKQVSSHIVNKDARRAGIVQEQFRAWSLSDAYWDSRALTVECANESTNGWTISDASHESLAQLVADWAHRYGFYPHRDGAPDSWTVIGHREVYSIHGGSYATACPGGMNLNRITKRAQELLAGGFAGGKVTIIMSWTDETTNLDPNTLQDSGKKSSRDWKLSFIEAYGKRVTNWLNRRIWGRTPEQNEKYLALLAEATAQTLGIQLPVPDKTGDFNTRPAAGQIKVDIAIDDKAATLIASKINVASGATPDEVRAILQAELGALVFRPDAKG